MLASPAQPRVAEERERGVVCYFDLREKVRVEVEMLPGSRIEMVMERGKFK